MEIDTIATVVECFPGALDCDGKIFCDLLNVHMFLLFFFSFIEADVVGCALQAVLLDTFAEADVSVSY